MISICAELALANSGKTEVNGQSQRTHQIDSASDRQSFLPRSAPTGALIMSVDTFNRGPAELVVAIPLTRTERKVRWHVSMNPPEGGLSDVSYIKCEDVRSLSRGRLTRFGGRVSLNTMIEVEDRLCILLGL
jgi:mRNA interferase MazF